MEDTRVSTEDENGVPIDPTSSRGSSVSTWMQDQYDEMLQYASVIPVNLQRVATEVDKDVQAIVEKYIHSADKTDFPRATSPDIPPEDLIDFSRAVDKSRSTAPNDLMTRSNDILPHATDFADEHHSGPVPRIDTPEVASSADFSDHYDVLYSANIDPDIGKMDALLDRWSQDLKRNVLAEFSQSKVRVIELGKYQIQKNRDRLETERSEIQNNVESMKEMLHTYEKTTNRQEGIIANLTMALQKQRDRQEMMKKFADWRIRHNDAKRETFCSNIAGKHYRHSMKRKIWLAWHSLLENKWQTRVTQACQARAEEVCVKLTDDYESKVASLNEALEISRAEIERLKSERERYEEMMKKAFMRGVCALNLEAMSMFHGDTENGGVDQVAASGDPVHGEFEDPPSPTVVPRCSVTKHRGDDNERNEVVIDPDAPMRAYTKPRKPRVLSTKITAKVDTGRKPTLGTENYQSKHAPMGSVIVERHQPLSRPTTPASACIQTIVAGINKPKKPAGMIQRKSTSHAPLITAHNIQPIKIVD